MTFAWCPATGPRYNAAGHVRTGEARTVAKQPISPRKQRTRQQVLADLSVHHVEGFVLEAGHTAQRLTHDYGYDLLLTTYDERGYIEPGLVNVQLKSMESMAATKSAYVYDLDVRDYNLWAVESEPVLLILFDAARRKAYWLHVQSYFHQDAARRPKAGAKTVRVRVPTRQLVSGKAVLKWREIKRGTFNQASTGRP